MAQQPRWQRFAGSVAENYNRYRVPAIFSHGQRILSRYRHPYRVNACRMSPAARVSMLA
jgi:hypothetical protein